MKKIIHCGLCGEAGHRRETCTGKKGYRLCPICGARPVADFDTGGKHKKIKSYCRECNLRVLQAQRSLKQSKNRPGSSAAQSAAVLTQVS